MRTTVTIEGELYAKALERASVILTPGAVLWSQDKRLVALAERYGVMQRPAEHWRR
ncbi:hypothetical protein [Roseateles cavernae]|uniref:hypothetical protein n=1 Tax=Roseateles cavernae TaxID=3153578 RepID=UPI0032E3D3A4